MPFLQELVAVLLHLLLERAQLMLRHAADCGNAAVAQPELSTPGSRQSRENQGLR